ncbi:MAG TPA: energy transducer TonB [Vicinamibacterales bacterium]
MTGSIRLAIFMTSFLAASAAAQDGLSRAREMYESAAYEDALVELGRLKSEASASAVPEIERYRALCLMALNRGSEADKVIESLVISDPLYQPATAEASPRVRTAFNSVRQRVLPGLARQLYIDAKALFDRKAYPEAVEALERTVKVIDTVDGAQKAELADLRVLAVGFLELGRASVTRPAAPTITTAPAPVQPPFPAAPLPLTSDLAVIKQDLPPLPFSLASAGKQEYRGLIEVQIDVTGNVTDARMLQPVHALYDVMLLKAAREWRYEPPRIGGQPTASRKRVEIVLRP